MPGVKIRIHNVVVSVAYGGVEFDLERFAGAIYGARYDPKNFPALVYRSDEPRASFIIFPSGRVNCVGTKSMRDVKLAINNLTRKLRRVGFLLLKSDDGL
jgi:transcription initiation factor TFIID TATA-box-binding protein